MQPKVCKKRIKKWIKMDQLDNAHFMWQRTESVVANNHPAHLSDTTSHNSNACFLQSGFWPCKESIPIF
jgi:hypothetical protein